MQKDVNPIPFDLRDQVWNVIRVLADDPEPTVQFESDYRGSNMDLATISINTVRGQALQTVIRYALWVRENLERLPNGKELLARGFGEMSEVRELLEAHLDARMEPSLSIRAIYGQWFPWISLLDENWARANKGTF
jgi:hypothetical protein